MVQQPLNNRTAIVNPDGTPNQYFIRLLQERGIITDDKITAAEAVALINAWAAGRDINAGVGLSGGGDLSSDVTIDLENTSVTPGSYTSANITVDPQGRITAAADGSGGGGGLDPIPGYRPFRANVATTFSSGNFGASLVLFPQACNITHVSTFITTANATSVIRPAVYALTSGGLMGALQAQGPQITGPAYGELKLPLTTPLAVTAGQYLFVGMQFLTTAAAVAFSDTAVFFASTGALPNPAPGSAAAVNALFWANVT